MSATDQPLDIADLAAARFLALSGEGRRIRQGARVTVMELAWHIGVSKLTIRRWESGQMIPRSQHAIAYISALRRIGLLGTVGAGPPGYPDASSAAD